MTRDGISHVGRYINECAKTHTEIAIEVGVSLSQLSRWKRQGRPIPHHHHLVKLAKACDAPLADLVDAAAKDAAEAIRNRHNFGIAIAALMIGVGSPPGFAHEGATTQEMGHAHRGGGCALRHVRAVGQRKRRGRKIVFARRPPAGGKPRT